MAKVSTESSNRVRQILSQLHPIPAEEWLKLEALLKPVTYNKKDCFARVGESVTDSAIVSKGLFRCYYLSPEGKIAMRSFHPEGSLVAAFSALITGTLSNVCVEAVEDDSELLQFNYAKYLALMKGHGCWKDISRKVAENLYVARERRQYELLSLDAETRFELFRKEYGNIIQRLNQQDIANYVGITPVSLSRIKAKMQKKKKAGV